MKDLEGKVAVVTGAASGLGRAMAERFGAEGMRLVLADIDAERLEAVGHALHEAGREVQTLRTDVSKQGQVEALADLAYQRFGGVDVLCNNAGVAVVGPAWERSIADWEWAIGVNLWGVVHGLRAFIPRMLAQSSEGHIVNTASIAGLMSPPLSAPYVATKHAVVGISECLYHDLALRQSKLGVSVLCPGFVRTSISESERARPDDFRDPAPQSDKLTEEVGEYYRSEVERGIEPAAVAEAVIESIRDNRFYILTHPDLDKALGNRFDDILERRNPKTRSLAQSTKD